MTAATTGLDVVDELTADHREATALLDQILSTSDPQTRRDMADTVITELVRHSVAEEMYVYPVMRDSVPGGAEEVEHDVEEHKELEQTMKALEDVDVSSPEFDERLRKLETILADHVQDEESEQFPEMRRRVPREELVELAGKVETAKKLAPTRPHPSAPHSELFHKIAGPGVGLVDRVKDMITQRATR